MNRLSSKALRYLTKLLFATLPLALVLLVEGCTDPVGLRNQLTRALDGSDLGARLQITDDGAVFARGPVQKVASSSFDLSGETFEVTSKTSMIDASGSELRVSDLKVGLVLEVDAVQMNDGTFEVDFAEVPMSAAAVADDGDGTEGDDGGETPDDSLTVDDSSRVAVGVLICHLPPGNPDNARTKMVGAAAVPAHLAHGDYEGACLEDAAPTDSTGVDSTGVDSTGVDSTQVSEGDDQGDDGEGDDEGDDSTSVKVTICHIPPGNHGNAKTKEVDEEDVQDHLDHGDHLDECTGDEGSVGQQDQGGSSGDQGDDSDEGDDGGEKVMICHIPPGNPDRAKTKLVDAGDVQEHLDHGDTLGSCDG